MKGCVVVRNSTDINSIFFHRGGLYVEEVNTGRIWFRTSRNTFYEPQSMQEAIKMRLNGEYSAEVYELICKLYNSTHTDQSTSWMLVVDA